MLQRFLKWVAGHKPESIRHDEINTPTDVPSYRVVPRWPESPFWVIEYTYDNWRTFNRVPKAITFYRRKRMGESSHVSEDEAIEQAKWLMSDPTRLPRWIQHEEQVLAQALEEQEAERKALRARTATYL